MKSAIGFLAVILVLTAAPAFSQSKTFEKTIQLGPGGLLSLDARRGSVRLAGWDRDVVEVRARIESSDNVPAAYAQRAIEATTVEVSSTSNRVVIRSNYDGVPSDTWLLGLFRTTPSIHYEIRAPRRLDLRLNVDRSNTTITGFDGRMVLEANRSEVEATDLSGDLNLRINRGGDSSLRNFRGSINVDAQRTNVRIDVVRLDAASRIQIHRGDADVSLSRNQGFELDTSLSRRVDFDSNLSFSFRGGNRNNPSGSINGGGPKLAIEADRSRVRLRG